MQDMYKATYGKRAWSFYLLYEQVTFPTSPGITTPIALQTPTLWVVMEASLYRHKWSHHGSTTKVILTKPTLVHNTLLTKAFQGLPFSSPPSWGPYKVLWILMGQAPHSFSPASCHSSQTSLPQSPSSWSSLTSSTASSWGVALPFPFAWKTLLPHIYKP